MEAVAREYFEPLHLRHFGKAARIESGVSIRAIYDSTYQPLEDEEPTYELSHALVIVRLPLVTPIRGQEPLGRTPPNIDGIVERRYRLRRIPDRPEFAQLEFRDGIRIELTESTSRDTRLRIIYPTQE